MRGYRIHLNLPGRPDIVFTRFRVVIFIDGCFWHCCPQCFREPKTHQSYWLPKLRRNADRDRAVTAALESAGWIVLRFWEHQLKHGPEILACVEEVQQALRGRASAGRQPAAGRPLSGKPGSEPPGQTGRPAHLQGSGCPDSSPETPAG